MNNLKRLGVVLALTLVLAGSAFACGTPDPGQIQTPPCAVSQITPDKPVAPSDVNTPPVSSSVSEFSVSDVVITLFVSMLPIF